MKQLLKDITIRRMILGTLLTISVLLAGMSAITINGLRGSADALTDSTELLHEVSALSRVNDQIMRARLRLSRQMEYAAAGDATQAAEEAAASMPPWPKPASSRPYSGTGRQRCPGRHPGSHEIGLRGPDRGGHRGPARPADGRRCGARPRPWRRPGRERQPRLRQEHRAIRGLRQGTRDPALGERRRQAPPRLYRHGRGAGRLPAAAGAGRPVCGAFRQASAGRLARPFPAHRRRRPDRADRGLRPQLRGAGDPLSAGHAGQPGPHRARGARGRT